MSYSLASKEGIGLVADGVRREAEVFKELCSTEARHADGVVLSGDVASPPKGLAARRRVRGHWPEYLRDVFELDF